MRKVKQASSVWLLQVFGLLVAASAMSLGSGHAATLIRNGVGYPVHAPMPWEWWLQPAGSPIEKSIDWLLRYVLWIMAGIVGLVGVLIGIIIHRFRASKNPVPSVTTHNTVIEIAWTLVPAILLIVIFVPSLHLIYQQSDYSKPYMTVRVIGHQWYWEYDYVDAKGVDFTSYAVPPDKLKPGQIRQLSVNHPLVLPAGKKIIFQITSADVLHSFFIPSLGVQRYAIPGQYWRQWTKIVSPGVYYGECNQICGMHHDDMPIEIVALPVTQFKAWVARAEIDAAHGNVPDVHAYEMAAERAVAHQEAPH